MPKSEGLAEKCCVNNGFTLHSYTLTLTLAAFVQIRSNQDELKEISYSISGPGADEPPRDLFRMEADTGILYITQPLDRELQAKYTVVVKAEIHKHPGTCAGFIFQQQVEKAS